MFGEQTLAQLRTGLRHKLQALVYDILPPTTGGFSRPIDHAIGLEKLSANDAKLLLPWTPWLLYSY